MRSKCKQLSSLLQSAVPASKSSHNPQDAALQNYVSTIDPLSPSTHLSKAIYKLSIKSPNSKKLPRKPKFEAQLPALILEEPSEPGDSMRHITEAISSVLCEGSSVKSPDAHGNGDQNSFEKLIDIPWFSIKSNHGTVLRRKEISRERKHKWILKNSQNHRFSQLVRNCAQKLGTDVTLEVFGRLGQETGVKEYNSLIDICLETAKASKDVEVVFDQIGKVYQLFKLMKEHGFQLEDGTYGPVLTYLIDMDMVEEFFFFIEAVKDANPDSNSRLGYYEMLFYVKINDEEKVQELCYYTTVDDGVDKYSLQENYLLALCECEQKKEILQLLEVMDIAKLSSTVQADIFKCLGRLSLHSFAEKLLLAFKTCGNGAENIPILIYNYAVSIPNLAIEDVVSKFKSMHFELDINPSSASYETLICYCCGLLKVHMAVDIVNEMCDADFTPSTDVLHSILYALDQGGEYNLVHHVYSLICRHNLKADSETFRSMISLFVKMKDFNGAYDMLKESEKMSLIPTASMYNAIMAGYFREKNTSNGLMVLKQMELAGVKPDSMTFSYLISNSESEEDMTKYYEELRSSGVQVTKHVFMALINAYAAHGQFEKAKQVVSDEGIPVKNLTEIRSVLVSALASHEQTADALKIYDEMKQAGCNLEPKVVISLIEHYPCDGPMNRILQLLGDLRRDLINWIYCCRRIILFSVKQNDLSSTSDLLKQLSYRCGNDEGTMELVFSEVFAFLAQSEPTYLETGLQLLQFIKNDLGCSPPRKCLDFLLGACANAKYAETSRLVWKEYENAGLPYNTISYLRMYQALLASGALKSAKVLLNKIPKDDVHVCWIIKACKLAYIASSKTKGKKGGNKKNADKESK